MKRNDNQNESTNLWNQLIAGPDAAHRLSSAMRRVARGLSKMSGKTITSDIPRVQTVPIAQIASRAGNPKVASVGIYLPIKDVMAGWALFALPLNKALNLVDLITEAPMGTAIRLGTEERSALAEMGNLAVSYFLNSVASLVQDPRPLRPSPPAVAVDRLSTILTLMITPVVASSDEIVIIETDFEDFIQAVQMRFWLLPKPGAD